MKVVAFLMFKGPYLNSAVFPVKSDELRYFKGIVHLKCALSHNLSFKIPCITLYLTKEFIMSVTTVRLQPEVEESLQAMTSSLQRSKSWLINQALKEYIERQALEQQQWQQTLDAMESV